MCIRDSDTLTFTFDLVKQCVTYTINVYEQKLEINNRNLSLIHI